MARVEFVLRGGHRLAPAPVTGNVALVRLRARGPWPVGTAWRGAGGRVLARHRVPVRR
ncbi:MAG: hypothetical protein M3P39_06835 [Actinomycetota bacterium]|nr:hypothetical protein [Actinomycetota bacterium]